MAKSKLYIAVKCGLIEDSKHRESIGNRIWLYLHMLNRCNWDTGQILEWRDEDEAKDLDMNHRTLTAQRQELADRGYISCTQKGNHQTITIHNWTNPRSYSAEILNRKGAQKTVPLEAEGTPEGTVEGSNELSTPSLNQITNNNSADKPRTPRKLTQLQQSQQSLIALFCELTHIQEPDHKSKSFGPLWCTPTAELIKQFNGKSEQVVRDAIKCMEQNNWPISSPKSIEKTAINVGRKIGFSTSATMTPDEALAASPHVRV